MPTCQALEVWLLDSRLLAKGLLLITSLIQTALRVTTNMIGIHLRVVGGTINNYSIIRGINWDCLRQPRTSGGLVTLSPRPPSRWGHFVLHSCSVTDGLLASVVTLQVLAIK